MHVYKQARKYQEYLGRKDMAGILDLFMPNAVIKAPISGTLGVADFHKRLFSYNKEAIVKLLNVFDGVGKTRSIALQFSYIWVLKNGVTVSFDGISVFEFDDALQKIKKLTVLYDPTELREHLRDSQIESVSLG